MRILLVNAHGVDTSAGGAERYVRDLTAGLSARGHNVDVLAAFPPRAQSDLSPAVVLHRDDWRQSLTRRILNRVNDIRSAASPALSEAIRKTSPDVVHTNSLAGITTGVWAAAASHGVPVIHTLHDYYLECARTSLTRRDGTACPARPLYCGFRADRLARHAPNVSHVIGVSQAIVDRHARFFPETAVHVIRHPLRRGASTRDPKSPPEVIGYIGRLEHEKGVDLLVAAAEEHGLRIRIAGSGRALRAVEAAADAGLVEYVGVVHGPGKSAFLETCDVGVVPSVWPEPGGPPYTVIEWLGAGRPVLVTPAGGLHEAAARYAGVFAFPPTAAGLAGKLKDVTPPPEIEDDSDVERWLDAHEQVYRATTR